MGLPTYSSFAQLTSDPVLQKSLAAIYGSIGNVDLFIGGLAENHAPGALVGPTFQAIIAAQFQALRDGDRFFWLNQKFDQRTTEMISQTTLADIIKRNTDITSLQENVFIAAPLPNHFRVSKPAGNVDNHGRKGCRSFSHEWRPVRLISSASFFAPPLRG
jgi:peroxidase